jgi:teichuronic acid biosynthesis glycosyltransferase TuaC
MARLLHVFHSFALGGSQSRLIRLINAFGSRDEHHIVTLTGDASAAALIQQPDTVRIIDGREVLGRARPAWRAIRIGLQKIAPDRLLTYNWGTIDWAIAALGTGIPHVAVEDGFGPEESTQRFLRRSLTRHAVFGWGGSQMFVASRSLEQIALREWHMPQRRVHFIPNGVEPERYRPVQERLRPSLYSRSPDERVIGTLAGLRPEKSLDRMIQAARIIAARQPIRLVIAGAGPLEASLRQCCEREGVADIVSFVGFQPDPARFLHELDLFMLSSQTEQLPISMIEAMLCGLPVVSTDVGDVRISLPAVQGPWIVERDPQALASAASDLLCDPQQSSALGLANRAHALTCFGPERMLQGWRRLFDGQQPEAVEPMHATARTPDGDGRAASSGPRVIVFSSLFPSPASPQAGVFIKERMFRVAKHLPLVVVSPQPWSPVDALIRRWRPEFRLAGPRYERMDGIDIHRPRYGSMPGLLKGLDGWSMALAARRTVRSLVREHPDSVLDAHFAYPDGYAASRLAQWLDRPLTLTLRGSKDSLLLGTPREAQLRQAVTSARYCFAVSDALQRTFEERFDLPSGSIEVVRNGVDTERFSPVSRDEARDRLGIARSARVILTVGWLVEGKGQQRIIPILARMRQQYPELVYLIVGGNAGGEDGHKRLADLAQAHGVADQVRLCGPQPPDELKWFYGAADLFALATRTEGWANVLLESMACGVPVVTTRVGGNAQVVRSESLGLLTEFWDEHAFEQALTEALFDRTWDREALMAYARHCGWETPVRTLTERLRSLGQTVTVPRPTGTVRRKEAPVSRLAV